MKSPILLVIPMLLLPTAGCASSDSSTASTGSGDEPAGASTKPTGTEAAYDGPTIPPGVYEKTFTEKYVKRLGLLDLYDGGFSPDGTSMVVYKFEDGFWSESSGPTRETVDEGSFGTHDYDEDGNLVIHEPCCGDGVLTWSLDGDILTMKMISPTVAVADPLTQLMRDGSYTRTE